MKLLVALCVLTLVALSSAKPQQFRGCQYDMFGRCRKECEEGTHGYSVGCGRVTPEPTCDEPNPKQREGELCDFSSCYCDAPTVRDRSSGKCVILDECPK